VETLNLVPGITLMTTALPKFGSAHILVQRKYL
jgi:hypothetical protein